MNCTARWPLFLMGALLLIVDGRAQAEDQPTALARQAEAILTANCHRCHGQDGTVEGGMNYILDRDKLLARKKILPGRPADSPLFKRVASGKMPPPDEQPRPSPSDLAIIKKWIDAGAPSARASVARAIVSEAEVDELILADLDRQEKRGRRFARYFSLAALANAGAGADELATYRLALAKLLNSLSWHPRIAQPKTIDTGGIVLRIDLRDYLWDANLWNRLLADYPYGTLGDTAAAQAVLVATATRKPCVRADWFLATASRAPLYYDLLQLPTSASELERQLRVDVALNIQQERVARAGFNGSGISRNNRVLERHDAQNGAYWRTYDFEAVPQNLIERDVLLPDRRNVFAYPLGPGFGEVSFQHAAGEIIFHLPNGLQGYMLVNAANTRQDKGATAIVSDPKRPDRAVEAGISCMSCHARGINFKDDQVRDHVAKNRKAFGRKDVELIRALYVPREKMRALMEEDAERFRRAVEKTGNRVDRAEVVMSMVLRYEADVDLPTLAAEVGLRPEQLLPPLASSENLARNLGALKVPGATVARQVVVQSYADLVRELRLGIPFQAGSVGQNLSDNTGEVDPLEAQSGPANAVAFSGDGRFIAIASADKSVRLWGVEENREVRRCIGHTASVWSVAFSPDGKRLLSGSKDAALRLWDVATGRELRKFEGHEDLVTSIAFSPDGSRALSGGFEGEVYLWDLDKDKYLKAFTLGDAARHVRAVAFAPDGKRALVCADRAVYVIDVTGGKVVRTLQGHTKAVVAAMFSPDGRWILSASDDRTMRLWDTATGHQVRGLGAKDHGVTSIAFGPDGKHVLSGGSDGSVRLWEAASGKEVSALRRHAQPLVGVAFYPGGRHTLSVSRDAAVQIWRLPGERFGAPR
jgi:mono/diheme cytochrome c family protein